MNGKDQMDASHPLRCGGVLAIHVMDVKTALDRSGITHGALEKISVDGRSCCNLVEYEYTGEEEWDGRLRRVLR